MANRCESSRLNEQPASSVIASSSISLVVCGGGQQSRGFVVPLLPPESVEPLKLLPEDTVEDRSEC